MVKWEACHLRQQALMLQYLQTFWTRLEEPTSIHRIAISHNQHLAYHSKKVGITPKALTEWTRPIYNREVAPRNISWEKIRPMDSTLLRKDSLTWKRCKRWVRIRDQAAMQHQIKQRLPAQPERHRSVFQLPCRSRDWTQSLQLVLELSSDNNLRKIPPVQSMVLKLAPQLKNSKDQAH